MLILWDKTVFQNTLLEAISSMGRVADRVSSEDTDRQTDILGIPTTLSYLSHLVEG